MKAERNYMEQKIIKIKLDTVEKIKRFLQVTRSFLSDIDIMTDRAIVDAKSVLGIYALNLSDDTYVRIISDNVVECRNFDAAMEEFR